MIYGNQLENINSHSDILAVSGGVPISKDLGDTLGTDVNEKFGSIYNVSIYPESVTCHTDVDITDHIARIRKKIKEASGGQEDKNKLLYDRLAGLTNNMLTVKLRSGTDNFLVKEELEIGIAYFNSFCYRTSRVKFGKSEYLIPKNVYDTAKSMSNMFSKTIKSIGGFLIIS